MAIKTKLKSLGLDSYEAEAYVQLCNEGTCTANELARSTAIPTGKIYATLNSLMDKQMIEVQNSRPKTYRAISAHIALSKLIESKEKEQKKELERVRKIQADLVTDLQFSTNPNINEPSFWVGGLNSEAKEVLRSTLAQTKHSIYAFVSPPEKEIQNPRSFAIPLLVVELAKKNIEVKIIANEEHKKKVAEKLGEEIRHVAIRTVAKPIKNPHMIIDDTMCFFQIQNPVDQDMLGAIRIENRELNFQLRKNFLSIWNSLKE